MFLLSVSVSSVLISLAPVTNSPEFRAFSDGVAKNWFEFSTPANSMTLYKKCIEDHNTDGATMCFSLSEHFDGSSAVTERRLFKRIAETDVVERMLFLSIEQRFGHRQALQCFTRGGRSLILGVEGPLTEDLWRVSVTGKGRVATDSLISLKVDREVIVHVPSFNLDRDGYWRFLNLEPSPQTLLHVVERSEIKSRRDLDVIRRLQTESDVSCDEVSTALSHSYDDAVFKGRLQHFQNINGKQQDTN